MEQRENEMPFIQFPLLGNTSIIVKITPHMYFIEENVVRDYIMRNKCSGSLPEKELNNYSTNEKRIKHWKNFENNPLYYMATDNKMIYGISTDKIKKIYEEQIKQMNEEEQDNGSDDEDNNNNNNNNHKIKKPKLTTSAISNTLNSILIVLKKIYGRKFSLDEVFPKTKIEQKKSKNNTYHKSDIRKETKRVIPMYIFPYLIKTRTFNKIPKLVVDIERFIDRLKRYVDANSMNSVKYHQDSLFQLKANLTQSIRDLDLTANIFNLNIIEYEKSYSDVVENNTILKRKVNSLEKNVNSLEKDAKEIKVDNQNIKSDLKKTRKYIKKKLTSSLDKFETMIN